MIKSTNILRLFRNETVKHTHTHNNPTDRSIEKNDEEHATFVSGCHNNENEKREKEKGNEKILIVTQR